MRYIFSDGLVVEARDAEELVSRLHALSRSPSDSDAEWLREAAARYSVQLGRPVRGGDARHFVVDLMRYSALKREIV